MLKKMLTALAALAFAVPAMAANTLYIEAVFTPGVTSGTSNFYVVQLAAGTTTCPTLDTSKALATSATPVIGTWQLQSTSPAPTSTTATTMVEFVAAWSTPYCVAATNTSTVNGATGGIESAPTPPVFLTTINQPATPAAPTGMTVTQVIQ